ncbi:MAG TPA: redoxin domain-containing protein, partial [Opitutus sp.]|nr:redoxin domain-containing protein [Opitutus sp.]
MRRYLLSAALLLAFAACPTLVAAAANPLLDAHGNPAGFRTLALGDRAPDFKLPGIDGRTHSLADFAQADVLMVLFTSNHCPTSHSIEKRLQKLRDDLRAQSFALVAINPNHPDGHSLDELGYGEYSDSFADMKPYAESNGWDFPYLYDGETQATARAYGCLATPHVFVFDKARRLRYAGRFDDSRFVEDSSVKSPDARNAVEALLAGREVPVALTKPHGCSTKWREKRATNVAIESSWTKLPVVMDRTDAAGVAALRANPTNKFRLINVWATWCAPCVEEFPSLVSLSRQFDMRDFELITISLDAAKDESKAQAFLQKQGAGVSKRIQPTIEKEGRKTNHYLYTGASNDELVAALDRDWPGPLPHTVLVAPGGEIRWRSTGGIDHAAA